MVRILFAALLMLPAFPAFAGDALKVMSFNVRYPAKSDGSNQWEFRRDLLVDTIREEDPDVVGTQELFYEQGEFITARLPQYAWFGISRRGNRQDEHMGVFYKKDSLRLVSSGDFWLSDRPEEAGSMSWNVSLPRMVTWALFEMPGSRQKFYFYNTHFPHRAEDAAARVRCAEVILERIARLPADVPFIMTGDFNSPADGEVHRMFTRVLQDAWTAAPGRSGPEHTFNGFGTVTSGARIDWILYRGALEPSKAATVARSTDGRFPSDHYPVVAVFDLGSKDGPR